MKMKDVCPRWNDLDDSVKVRMAVEVRIVAATIRGILATRNYTLYGIDLDEGIEKTPLFEDAMKLAFDLDDARMFFRNKVTKELSWVYFVFGNSGYDVINDWTMSGDGFNEAVQAASDVHDNGDEEV